MTWSKNHPEAASDAKEQLKAQASNIEPDLVISCASIADEKKDKLEELANDRNITPDPNGEYAPQARGFIKKINDSNSNDITEISELVNHNFEFEMSKLKREIAMSVVGLLILQNGSDDQPNDPMEFFRQEADLQN